MVIFVNNSFFVHPLCEASKVKLYPLHAMEAQRGERRYSSYSYLTSALDGGKWSASRPKTLYDTKKISTKR
jgi:hypothetical protein